MRYLALLLFATFNLYSNENINIENDFLQSLNEVSEIATKTKLNIDDAPSFVTVLQNQKLQKLGITTVFEALSLVPGVTLRREATGVPVVIFRGLSQKGEVKLMVDGININNTYRGSIYHYLDFPIELVERIEVIRGAGSVLYGSGAISGVINVITKTANISNSNTAYISAGEDNSYRAGTYFSSKYEGIKIAADAYYHDSEKMVENNDRHLKDYSVGLNLNKDNFEFIARLKNSDQGNAYGIFGVKDTQLNMYTNINDTTFMQLSYKEDLDKDNKLTVLAGRSTYEQNADDEHPSPAVNSVFASFKEENLYVQSDLISNTFEDHQILVGMKFESSKAKESNWNADGNSIPAVVHPGLSRETTSIYAVDNYSATPKLDISAGIRYDRYSDFSNAFSPNLGVVYRLNDSIKLKALYNHAYRAPSWIELTSNPSLNAEESHALETGIIYEKNHQNKFKINLYRFKIDDMITKEATYIQTTKNIFKGVEFEYIYTPNINLEMNFFASYVDAKNGNGNNLADISNFLAATTVILNHSGFNFGSHLKYISSSDRAIGDTREKMSDNFIFDQTLSYNFKEFTASLIIKDLFNDGKYCPLPSSRGIDFNDGGRTVLLNTTIEF